MHIYTIEYVYILILRGETECSIQVNFTFIILKRTARLPLLADNFSAYD